MDEKREATNIRIYKDTKEELEKIGKYGDTADTIIQKLIQFYNEHK